MNTQPLVSIIMPSYNSGEFIEDSIKSVLDQTYHNWELIIIDDCSTDNTISIVESLNNNKIKIIKNKNNLGAAKSRNKGIEIAQGQFIAFLDSDDLWHKEKLRIQTSYMKENNISFTYCAYEKINEHNKVIGNVSVPEKIDRNTLLKTCYIGCLTAIYDTQKLNKVYMPEDTRREDYATWLNIIREVKFIYGINKTLASYRVHSKQSSNKKIKMATENWKIYKEIENLGFSRSIYYFSHYAIRGFLRTKMPNLARFLKVL